MKKNFGLTMQHAHKGLLKTVTLLLVHPVCIGLQKIKIWFMIGFETRALGKPRGGKSFGLR
jgi:hypothetical protein